ncbi:MAG: glycosyltransferase family 4 protein [Alphaproteobacteria bacterium]
MRILLVHERYRERGGEDAAVDGEIAQLRDAGVDVATLIEDNDRIRGEGSLGLALNTLWSPAGRRAVAAAIRSARPDLVHVHNFFPLLSPSIYGAVHDAGLPVVQTLHNYRLICPGALLLRDGGACELCVERRIKWPAVRHACYRTSHAASATVAAMDGLHSLLGTFRRRVDRFIALSLTAAQQFVRGGIPAAQIAVIPNAVADPGPPRMDGRSGALFVGRLSPEKGLDTVLAAWRHIDWPLTVIGDGPDAARLKAAAPAQVRFLGRRSPDQVAQAMAGAELLVFPSLCRENLPTVILEAMAHGVPVLASGGGAAEDMILPDVSGALAPPGDVAVWRDAIATLRSDPVRRAGLAREGRAAYEAHYTPSRVVARRLALYRALLEERRTP